MLKKLVVTKNIRSLENNDLSKNLSMAEFIDTCKKELKPELVKTQEITITKPEELALAKVKSDFLVLKNVPIEIPETDVAKIINTIIQIMTDPLLVASLLKELDTELGAQLEKNNITFTDNDLPEFLISGMGNLIPGPPPENYLPKKKQRLLDQILQTYEHKNGINENGAPKFVGAVDEIDANKLVSSGYLFTESKQNSRLLLHGAFSHRLAFHVLFQAAQSNLLDLTYGSDGNKLNFQQLLQILVHGEYYQKFTDSVLKRNGLSLWELTIDSLIDTRYPERTSIFNLNEFSFSCRSPFVFNGLLLCFGEELNLRNLQRYLLDSHWKAAYEMVYRVKNVMGSTNIPDSTIYTYCMEAFSTTPKGPGNVVINLPFTLSNSDALSRPMYKRFCADMSASIVKKDLRSSPGGTYSSWQEFQEEKSARSAPAADPVISKEQLKV